MKPLIIFEVANNHQGSVDHALRIIAGLGARKREYESLFDFAVKFQFRNLDTFIDPAADSSSNKHIARFRSTRLQTGDWPAILAAVHDRGMLSITTVFDEESVDLAARLGLTTLKIASSSANDWSLLQKTCAVASHVIVSTAGLTLGEVDTLYTFLRHESRPEFTLLHCVGVYPAAPGDLNLLSIRRFVERYPKARVGYSGHEAPEAHHVSALALASGAQVFERHVGVATSEHPLNAYSLDLDSVGRWLAAMAEATLILGHARSPAYSHPAERASLDALRRGVFARVDIEAGVEIVPEMVALQFPLREHQLAASDFSTVYHRFMSTDAIRAGEPVSSVNSRVIVDTRSRDLDRYVQRVRGIATEAHIDIADDELLEVSHHFGVDQLWHYGCCIVNVLNRSYCKKLIFMVEGQEHPEQYHRVKEETLRVVFGELELEVGGTTHKLARGQAVVVEANAKHRFRALADTVIEELSTTSSPADSFYTDPRISSRPRTARKTMMRNFPGGTD